MRRRSAAPGRHVVLLAMLLAALPNVARGHAVVTRTSLDSSPIVAERPSEVTLHFNGAIETSHTAVTLVDASGKARALSLVPGVRNPAPW
jgi:methionine-rich copper-binding protein CopC